MLPSSHWSTPEALNPALFTPAYLAGVEQNFTASCGPAAPLSTQDLYYQINAAAPRATYDGGEFNLHLDASRYFSADLSYGMMLARAYGNAGPLFSNGSTVVSGRQLPNQPIRTANLSLAALVGKAGVTALANVHYVSANNPNNLPAYVVVDAGLQMPLKQGGTLTLSLLNLTNTFGGTFATVNGSVPLATQSGSFATIATPLTPHSINVAWRMPFGYGAQLLDVPSYDPGPNAFGFKLWPYPNVPPADPFAIDRRSGRCGPEALPGSTKYLSILREYVGRIEAAREQSGSYPVTFPDENKLGMRLYYRRNGQSFAVLIAVDKSLRWDDQLAVLKPLTGCARITSGLLPETQRRHLYIPPYDEQQSLVPFFDFAPEVGFYYPPSLIENQSLFPAYAESSGSSAYGSICDFEDRQMLLECNLRCAGVCLVNAALYNRVLRSTRNPERTRRIHYNTSRFERRHVAGDCVAGRRCNATLTVPNNSGGTPGRALQDRSRRHAVL